jgi:hypothetical protein
MVLQRTLWESRTLPAFFPREASVIRLALRLFLLNPLPLASSCSKA